MKLFTILNGEINEGILVDKGHLEGSMDDFPVIYYAEVTGGCRKQMLVKLNPLQIRSWKMDGKITIKTGIIKQSIRNNPILDTRPVSRDNKRIVCFIVGGTVEGGRSGEEITNYYETDKVLPLHYPFSGEVIGSGFLRSTDRGETTKLKTMIAVIEKDVIFSITNDDTGYLYKNTLYYKWDGNRLTKYSWAEMEYYLS